MKILMVSPYFYPEGGGLENYVYHLSKGLVKKGNSVTVLCATKEGQDKTEKIGGVKVMRKKPDFRISNTPIILNWNRLVSDVVDKERPDVINGHLPVPFIADFACRVAKRKGVKFVLTYHCGTMKKGRFLIDLLIGLYEKTMLRILLKMTDSIICNSDFVRNEFLKDYKHKSVTITPGVDTKKYKPSKEKIDNHILFVGQLDRSHEWKGLYYLIDAVSLIHKQGKLLNLTVIGGGDHIKNYQDYCKEKGVDEIIEFKGKVIGSRLIRFYQTSSMLILPSYSNAEGFGMVLIEAMACGTPIIGTNVGGIPYVIKNRHNGLLVPSKDAHALANAIIELMNNESLADRLIKNGYKTVQNFTWEKNIKKFENVIRQIG